MSRFFLKFSGTLFTLALIGALAGAAVAAYLIHYYSKDLPDYTQLAEYNPPIVSRLYAGDGRLLEEYAKENRLFVPIQAIPKRVSNAFLAAEDKNFYTHPGVDLYSLLRAIMQNIMNISHNKSLVGGSTITQQVVKNFLLTNERSLSRKIKEAILSFRISQAYSKDRILELYLNQIYLGAGSYGVASAALNYFNKSLDELNIEEAAFLAALPKAPSTYDPRKNYNRAKARRDWVIDMMAEAAFIKQEEANMARNTPIVLRYRDKEEVVKADFFAEAVRREIVAQYGSNTLYEGGLAVRTTIVPSLQAIADKAFREGLIAYDRHHGFRKPFTRFSTLDNWQEQLHKLPYPPAISPWELAVVLETHKDKAVIGLEKGKKASIPLSELKWARTVVNSAADILHKGDVVTVEAVDAKKALYGLRQLPEVSGGLIVMDPHTGKVLAMVGGYYYGDSQFNRAMQAKRQPGSAFKPFVYLSALENGFTPASIVVDGPIELPQGPGLPMWRPKNYHGDFLGPTILRRGLEKSRNTMTVKLAQMLGIRKIVEVTKRFGINQNPQRNFSMVLGAAETTLLDLTNAYAMVVNGGKRIRPALIERIQDRNGNTIFKRDERKCTECAIVSETQLSLSFPPELEDTRENVTDPRSAYQLVSMLEGVVQRGTATAAKKLGRTLGGKTGTTNDSFDTWFIGFSPDLVVGTYVGFDAPRSLGKKETGASVTLPIFVRFMEEALKNKPDTPFRLPPGIKLVRIDMNTGRPPAPDTPEKQIIFEVFKTGTEPGMPARDEKPASSGSTETLHPSSPPEAPTIGTGGIY